MKLQVKRLDGRTREGVAQALYEYANTFNPVYSEIVVRYQQLSTHIRHGELLLCEYIDTDVEKGGHYGV